MIQAVPTLLFRTAALLLSLVVLTGCWPQGASQRWEVAIRGAYSGSLTDDASRLLVGSIHHGGSLWDARAPARQYDWNHDDTGYTEILYTAFSADRSYALTADYHTLALWRMADGESAAYWSAPARIQAVDLSGDGRFALLGLSNNSAVLFDAVNGGVIREFQHNGPVVSVAISDDASTVLTGSEDLTARLWNVPDDRMVRQYDMANQVTLVQLSGDGDTALLAPASEPAEVWALDSQSRLSTLPTGDHRLYSARFSGVDQLLVGTTHRRLFQFNARTGERTGAWQLGSFWQNAFHSATVLDMTWRNDRLWALGSDGFLYTF